jgi:hypothetical protein
MGHPSGYSAPQSRPQQHLLREREIHRKQTVYKNRKFDGSGRPRGKNG